MSAALALLFLVAPPPPRPATPLQDYRSQQLVLELGFYGSVTLRRDGEDAGFGYFGTGAQRIFAGHPEALEAAMTFRRMRIAGVVLTAVGGATLITQLVLLLLDSEALVDHGATGREGLRPLTFIMLGSGLGLSIGGVLLEAGAGAYASRAVREYNRALYERQHRREGRAALLRVGGRF